MSEISWSYKEISLKWFGDTHIEHYEYCSKYHVRVGDKHNAVDILETKDKRIVDKFVEDLEVIISNIVVEE